MKRRGHRKMPHHTLILNATYGSELFLTERGEFVKNWFNAHLTRMFMSYEQDHPFHMNSEYRKKLV